MTATKNVRYRFVVDEDAQFEECNGESRPLTADEYAENSYRACPDHLQAGTKVLTFGPPQVQGCATCGTPGKDYQDIPYAEYLRYYGNPDRHVYLRLIQETECACCQSWKVTDSLWHIDMMDDSEEYLTLTHPDYMGDNFTPWAATRLPGYLGELVRDMETERAQ